MATNVFLYWHATQFETLTQYICRWLFLLPTLRIMRANQATSASVPALQVESGGREVSMAVMTVPVLAEFGLAVLP